MTRFAGSLILGLMFGIGACSSNATDSPIPAAEKPAPVAWPPFRGPGGLGVTSETVPVETVYEERLSRVGGMYGSPVLAGGRLYFVSRQGGETVVVPVGPRFRELARNSFGERSRSNASPAVADGRLYLPTDDYLYCAGEK